MIIKAYNDKHKYLLFIDIEFDMKKLVQFAGLLFKRIDEDGTYQLMRSYNAYVNTKICYPFKEYTRITNNWLEDNGVPLEDIKIFIMEDLLNDVDPHDLEIISHGLKNDRLILQENGINLSNYLEGGVRKPIDGYCTCNNARRILKRTTHLTLEELAEESGFFLYAAHNAFNDVWAEVSVFTTLKKIEAGEKQ